jgi:hypothetical protein
MLLALRVTRPLRSPKLEIEIKVAVLTEKIDHAFAVVCVNFLVEPAFADALCEQL